jgi:hypothetical protein
MNSALPAPTPSDHNNGELGGKYQSPRTNFFTAIKIRKGSGRQFALNPFFGQCDDQSDDRSMSSCLGISKRRKRRTERRLTASTHLIRSGMKFSSRKETSSDQTVGSQGNIQPCDSIGLCVSSLHEACDGQSLSLNEENSLYAKEEHDDKKVYINPNDNGILARAYILPKHPKPISFKESSQSDFIVVLNQKEKSRSQLISDLTQ